MHDNKPYGQMLQYQIIKFVAGTESEILVDTNSKKEHDRIVGVFFYSNTNLNQSTIRLDIDNEEIFKDVILKIHQVTENLGYRDIYHELNCKADASTITARIKTDGLTPGDVIFMHLMCIRKCDPKA